MDRDEFWALVEGARASVGETLTSEGAEAVAQQLVGDLAALGPSAALEFDQIYDRLEDESYRWDLWAAAFLMRGGCSDDGFDYFRGWLVAQGRAVWEQALADPDSLADLGVDPDDDRVECEDILSVASSAYAAATGDEEAFWTTVTAAARDLPETKAPGPVGEYFNFNDDDERMRALLPRLAAIYLPAEGSD